MAAQAQADHTDQGCVFEFDPLAVRYLAHVRVEKRLAPRTVALYAADLQKLQTSALAAGVSLQSVQNTHIRRWVAHMHSAGRTARGIALILSGWRGFYSWLGREGLVLSNPVQDVRAPKVPKPLPKALGVEEAVQLASFRAEDAHPIWWGWMCRMARMPAAGLTAKALRRMSWARAVKSAACQWAARRSLPWLNGSASARSGLKLTPPCSSTSAASV